MVKPVRAAHGDRLTRVHGSRFRRPRLGYSTSAEPVATSWRRRTTCSVTGPACEATPGPGAGLADGRAESVGRVAAAGYLLLATVCPAPELAVRSQRHTAGRSSAPRTSRGPEHSLLGEFDGRVKYGRLPAARRVARRCGLQGEASARTGSVRRCGWRMIRLVWADLHRPAETAARIAGCSAWPPDPRRTPARLPMRGTEPRPALRGWPHEPPLPTENWRLPREVHRGKRQFLGITWETAAAHPTLRRAPARSSPGPRPR